MIEHSDREQDRILRKYSEALSRDKHTQSTSLIYARAYIDHSGGAMTRAAVLDFLEATAETGILNPLPRKKAVAAGTQKVIFGILRRLFLANDAIWPFRKGEGPKANERARRHVALAPELVQRAIGMALQGQLSSQESSYLALATVYGMRKMEMAAVRPEHFDFDKGTLYVAAEKGGAERYHLVPDYVSAILAEYDWSQVLSATQADYIWTRIEKSCDFPDVPGLGWHAIRRILVTLLWDVLPEPRINRFLRWRTGETSAMSLRYHSIQVVGDDASSFKVDKAELEEDAAVFKVHPFVEMWKGQARLPSM